MSSSSTQHNTTQHIHQSNNIQEQEGRHLHSLWVGNVEKVLRVGLQFDVCALWQGRTLYSDDIPLLEQHILHHLCITASCPKSAAVNATFSTNKHFAKAFLPPYSTNE